MKTNLLKSTILLLALTASLSVWGDAVPSGEMFATYQKFGDTFYEGGGEANLEATSHYWNVNYYIVTCGDSALLRATTAEENNLGGGYQTQLRIWTGAYGNSCEVQVNAGDNKNRYMTIAKDILPKADDVKIHLFLHWAGNSTTQTFNFNRASINNPIEDNVAPSINPEEVTMTDVDGKLIFTFGDVTADDQYFYYVADKDHNVGSISLTNKVYITKPTVEDGTTYKFKCYAVDYNGNKSAYKEFTLTMPFDPAIDLAFKKSCIAGYSYGTDTPNKAVNGAEDHWGTFQISDYSQNWWRVDLGNAYDLSEIDITFATTNTYRIETSIDDSNWQTILDNQPAASPVTHNSLASAARYVRLTAIGHNMIAIRHFKVYASGLAAADATNPTVSASCTATTVNTATLQIIAADEDDAHNAGTITSIKVTGDNGFVEQEVLSSLDGENKVTLSSLTYNTTYHFTVTAYDRAGNHASNNIEVVLPFNTALNLAGGKTATASAVQGDNPAWVAEKAVDGDGETYWTCYGIGTDESDIWWHVDLGIVYDVNRVVVTFNDVAGAYNIYASDDDTHWIPVVESATASKGETRTYSGLILAARYFKVNSVNHDFGIKEFEVYGTGFSVADATNPTVIVTCPTKTINSATLQINASDLDDAGDPGTIAYINISGDNDFVTQNNVALNGSNQITLEGLNYNTTYTFTVTVQDRRRNETNTNITVQLPLNTNFNLAQGKTAVAGAVQAGYPANQGCDGKDGTMWSSYTGNDRSKDWWYVDLGAIYKVRQVSIKWMNDNAVRFLIQGVNTLPAEEDIANDNAWTTYLDYTYEIDPGTTKQDHAVVGKMRYLRLKALQTADINGINFYELEVYGSDYAEEDNVAPYITTEGCTTNTETAEATLTLVAEDAVDGKISDFYISCEDPIMPETKYTTDENDQIVIGELEIDKDYTFAIRFRDLSGNWRSTTLIAHFAMALGTNVAEGKTATAGREENADHVAGKAVDDNDGTYWGNYMAGGVDLEGEINWWKVDLVNGFKLNNIVIKWEHYPDAGGIIIEGSLNDVNYSEIISYSAGTPGSRQVLEITGEQATIPYRYIRIKAGNQAKYMSFYEFEVYASEEIPLLTFEDDAELEYNTALIAAHNGETSNVVINRSIAANNTWYTLCLPFDMDADKVIEVFGASTIATLTGSEDRGSLIHLNFDYVDAMEAGKPYMIKVSNSFASGTQIEGVTIKNVNPSATPQKSEAPHMHFQGTFDKIMLEGANKRYVSANNELFTPNPNGGSRIGAFRCYFTIPDEQQNNVMGRQAKIVFGPQTATGCENIATPDTPSKFMLNGVLYILRDGKTYNAQGQLIQ